MKNTNHVLYVKPYSEAEKRLMELFGKIGPGYSVSCILGSLYGLTYNTYIFEEDAYLAIRNLLLTEELA